ncbi:UNVERIFIED_CONTAM: hypothetical protein PYX00_010936 [Menopon gallinae]|uniref:Glucosamine-6-phosphate isomerase n=1 Tax=Menopon gallinae TaxID=328185 RepID=A0AAW2H6T0_9NEOP
MRLVIKKDAQEMCEWVAEYVVKAINTFKPTEERPFVIGLPTGGTIVPVYRSLVNLYKQAKVSFENVVSFNMDEYVGLKEDHPQSYHYFMWDNFFSHVNFKKENINILNGNAPDLVQECAEFEKKIEKAGGIHLFLGGIGVDGHLAFNEPASSLSSRTRIKTLTHDTRIANARFFGGRIEQVPHQALTVGVATVMEAEELIILVNGLAKARALRHTVEGSLSHMWTASAIQTHPKGIVVCDEPATYELKVGTVNYFKQVEESLVK